MGGAEGGRGRPRLCTVARREGSPRLCAAAGGGRGRGGGRDRPRLCAVAGEEIAPALRGRGGREGSPTRSRPAENPIGGPNARGLTPTAPATTPRAQSPERRLSTPGAHAQWRPCPYCADMPPARSSAFPTPPTAGLTFAEQRGCWWPIDRRACPFRLGPRAPKAKTVPGLGTRGPIDRYRGPKRPKRAWPAGTWANSPRGKIARSRPSYTPVEYPSVIVGQNAAQCAAFEPTITPSPRFRVLFRTLTGEMSGAPLAPARTRPLLTHNPWPETSAVQSLGHGAGPGSAPPARNVRLRAGWRPTDQSNAEAPNRSPTTRQPRPPEQYLSPQRSPATRQPRPPEQCLSPNRLAATRPSWRVQLVCPGMRQATGRPRGPRSVSIRTRPGRVYSVTQGAGARDEPGRLRRTRLVFDRGRRDARGRFPRPRDQSHRTRPRETRTRSE